MHNVVMFVPRRADAVPELSSDDQICLLGCLLSAVPTLLAMRHEAKGAATDGEYIGPFVLGFERESDWRASQISQEWMDLLDATSHLVDWEAAQIEHTDTSTQVLELRVAS